MKKIIYDLIDRKDERMEKVFGKPVQYKDFTIIPVANVEYAGSGSDEEISEMTPLGYIEIRDSTTRFVSLYNPAEMIALGGLSGLGIAGVLALFRRITAKPSSQTKGEEPAGGLRTLVSVVGISLGVLSLALTVGKICRKSPDPLADLGALLEDTFFPCAQASRIGFPAGDAQWEKASIERIEEKPEALDHTQEHD